MQVDFLGYKEILIEENKNKNWNYKNVPNSHKRTFEYYLKSAYLTFEHILIQGFFSLHRENQNLSCEKMKILSLKKKVPVNIQNCLWFDFSWHSVREKTKLPITREQNQVFARKTIFCP